jgi:phosphatidylinositol-bisphosphatase
MTSGTTSLSWSASTQRSQAATPLPAVSQSVPELDRGTLARREYVNREAERRAAEYTRLRELRFFVGTFNVNAKPPVFDLSPLLRDHKTSTPPQDMLWDSWAGANGAALSGVNAGAKPAMAEVTADVGDVLIFGFQEVQKLSGTAAVITDESQGRPWRDSVQALLDTHGSYVCVVQRQLVGILLLVFVRADHANAIQNVQITSAGTGIAGVGGNKGGVAARFQLYDTNICCVCCHLSAHEQNLEKRNAEYRAIMERVVFNPVGDDGGNPAPFVPTYPGLYPAPQSTTIMDHDVVFFFGDLNYRIALRPEEVMRCIEAADWPYLASHDQLNSCRSMGFAFEPFSEAPLHFPPTYKYKPFENAYENDPDRPGLLKRTPAWCDRILYRGNGIRTRSYRRHEIFASDHRPVSGLFTVPIQQIDRERRQAVYDRLWREMSRRENETIPRLAVSENDIVLGTIHFRSPLYVHFSITNVGRVRTRWYLPIQYLKRWMHCVPSSGELEPKQQVRVRIQILVDEHCGYSAMLAEAPRIESTLVVQAENGAACFVALHGRYAPTIYGCSLELLATRNGGNGFIVPELWLIGDALLRRNILGVNPSLFVEDCSDAPAVQALRDALCNSVAAVREEALQKAPSLAIGQVLVEFLRYLETPIVPFELYESFTQAAESGDACAVLYVMTNAAPIYRNTFVYVLAMVREHIQRLVHDGRLGDAVDPMQMTTRLARVFGTAMLRRRTSEHHSEDDTGAAVLERTRSLLPLIRVANDHDGQRVARNSSSSPSDIDERAQFPLYELLFDSI